MDLKGSPWNPIDPYGNKWILMDGSIIIKRDPSGSKEIHQDPLEFIIMNRSVSESGGIHLDLKISIGIHWDPSGSIDIHLDQSESILIRQDPLGSNQKGSIRIHRDP